MHYVHQQSYVRTQCPLTFMYKLTMFIPTYALTLYIYMSALIMSIFTYALTMSFCTFTSIRTYALIMSFCTLMAIHISELTLMMSFCTLMPIRTYPLIMSFVRKLQTKTRNKRNKKQKNPINNDRRTIWHNLCWTNLEWVHDQISAGSFLFFFAENLKTEQEVWIPGSFIINRCVII